MNNLLSTRVRLDAKEIGLIAMSITWPFAGFMGKNYSQLAGSDIRVLCLSAATLLIVVLGAYAFAVRLRKGSAVSIGVSVFIYCLFTYSVWKSMGAHVSVPADYEWIIPASWLAISATVAGVAAFFSKIRPLRIFILVAVASVFATSGLGAAYTLATSISLDRVSEPQRAVASNASRPNVYFIILDTYLRSDLLRKVFNFDNSSFERDLSNLGFQIAEKSYSNYPNTRLSLASMLEMNYIVDESHEPDTPSSEVYPTQGRFSTVAKRMSELGYDLVFATDGATIGFGCGADQYSRSLDQDPLMTSSVWSYCIPASEGWSQSALTFLSSTPALDLIHSVFGKVVTASLMEIPQVEERLPLRGSKPKFLLAHILLPHLPGRYDSDCNRVDNENQLIAPSTEEGGKLGSQYMGNLACANRQTVSLVRKIVEADPNAIIHVTGDHGIYFGLVDEMQAREFDATPGVGIHEDVASGRFKPSHGVLQQMFAIFNATRLPSSCAGLHRQNVGPVNSMRLILTCLGAKDLPLLPEKSFASDYTGHVVRELPELEIHGSASLQ